MGCKLVIKKSLFLESSSLKPTDLSQFSADAFKLIIFILKEKL